MIRLATVATGLLLLGSVVSAQQATTIALTSVTPAAPVFGQTVIFTAQVTPAAAPGSVSFMDQGVLVGTGTVSPGGSAQATSLTLRAGQHSLSAIYGGDSGTGYQASQSAATPYIVTAIAGQGFSATVNYTTPPGTQAGGMGDFNGDGKADLIIAGGGFGNIGTVNVLLGNGDGTFQAAADGYAVGNDPWSLALGDFNGDGATDAAVVNQFSNNVSILLGNGDGTFQAAVNYGVGANPISIMVGDFNRDGRADLAVANSASANVSVLLGKGDGTFQTAAGYPAGNGPNAMGLGDFNGDGFTDLAVAKSPASSNVGILLGNGDGTFRAAVNYPAAANPSAVVVFDFNLDGKADLAIADGYDGYISILLGNGDGTFNSPMHYPAPYPASIAVADFNGDGIADLSAANYFYGSASVLLGTGNGGFSGALNYTTSGSPIAIIAGDFNGDGRADLAAATTGGQISVLAALAANPTTTALQSSSSPSVFGQAITLTATVVPSNAPGTVEFLDGTSILGVKPLVSGQAQIVTNLLPAGSNSLTAVYSGGPGWDPSQSSAFGQSVNPVVSAGFAPTVDIALGSTPVSVAIADLNGDGISDLAAVSQGGTIGIMLGRGNGTFATATNYAAGSEASSVAVGDFNRDGKQDLVVTGYALSYGVSILFGKGDGTFSAPATFYPVSGATFVAVADFNKDGNPDLIVANSATNVLLGNGDGTFQNALSYGNGNPAFFALGDLNGDGIPDVVTGSEFNVLVAVQLGNGNGTFQTPVYYPIGAPGGSIAIGDFNGDGKPDLVAATQGGVISIALGNGDGTFQTASTYPTKGGSNALHLAAGDFDGDGNLDIVVTDPDANKAYVLRGNGDGSFQLAAPYTVGAKPLGVAVGDFNGDGRADLAIADADISILLGTGPSPGPLEFYPVAPCRLVDTRGIAAGFNGIAPFSGPSIAAGGTLTIPVQSASEVSTNTTPAPCGVIPSTAQAYSINITVVPQAEGAVDYVSLWPAGSAKPFVSTLDDPEGLIVANAAVVPAGTPGGGISIFNAGPSTADVIVDMNGYFAAPTSLQFYPVAPCRLVDTRGLAAGFNGIDPFAGPSIAAGDTLTIPVQSTAEAAADTLPAPCGTIPSTAQAYSFNLTVVPADGGAVDYVSLWPAGSPKPFVSTLDDPEGLIVANAAIVPAGASSGGVSVFNAGPATADVILDMNGYFAPPTTALQFYPVAPCRLVDTRGAAAGFNGIGPFSGPSIAAGGTLTIPVQSAAEAAANTAPAPCGTIPSTAQAYSINLTVVPHAGGAVDYVSLWPAGSAQPFVSTLNDPEGLIVANAAIVPAGTPSGGMSVFNAGPSTTDVIIDMNGYFAP